MYFDIPGISGLDRPKPDPPVVKHEKKHKTGSKRSAEGYAILNQMILYIRTVTRNPYQKQKQAKIRFSKSCQEPDFVS